MCIDWKTFWEIVAKPHYIHNLLLHLKKTQKIPSKRSLLLFARIYCAQPVVDVYYNSKLFPLCKYIAFSLKDWETNNGRCQKPILTKRNVYWKFLKCEYKVLLQERIELRKLFKRNFWPGRKNELLNLILTYFYEDVGEYLVYNMHKTMERFIEMSDEKFYVLHLKWLDRENVQSSS